MSSESCPAVVLRSAALREADLILALLTPERGKVEVLARGARKSRRRFAGGLSVGSRGRAELTFGRSKMPTVSGFVPTADNSLIGRDLEAFAYTAYLCELCDHLVDAGSPDPLLFAELCDGVERACASSRSPAVLRRFELRLLDRLGLSPAFSECGACGASLEGEEVAFAPERGGALCALHARGAVPWPRSVVETAAAMVVPGEEGMQRYEGLERPLRRAFRDLCRQLLRPHLRRPLRSVAAFRQLTRPGAKAGVTDVDPESA